MFKNNNREIIRELAVENGKSHLAGCATAVLAIALTTILITVVFTAGMSFVSTATNAGEQAPGPGADGCLYGDEQVYEQALIQEEVEWADYVQVCSSAPLHNNEFSGIDTRLFAPDARFYQDNYVDLLEGGYPKGKNDMLISDTMAETLGLNLEEAVGAEFTLEVPILRGEELVETEIGMTVCGVYENPLFSISSIYEEIYTDPSFIPKYNPELPPEWNIIYVKLNNLNPLLLRTDVGSSLDGLKEATGATAFSSGKNSADLLSAFAAFLPVLILALLLMASGYFLISNVFDLSVTNDIRWYGMLKTIGATSSQLKSILRRQALGLAVVGITVGLAVGYLIGLAVAPGIMGMTDWAVYYKAPGFLPVAAMAAVFSLATVAVSCGKPFRIAARISPVEAAKYTPKRRKTVFTVISLSLSGIIFLAVSNVTLGFDAEVFAERYNLEDYTVMHKGNLWGLDEPYKPITPDFPDRLAALPFVKRVDTCYMARTDGEKPSGEWKMYPESFGEIADRGNFAQAIRAQYPAKGQGTYNGRSLTNERGNLQIGINGIPAVTLEEEKKNYRILSGVLDGDKFSEGGYCIVQKLFDAVSDGSVRAGDELDITFYDNTTGREKEKQLTVLAVVESAHEYTSSNVSPDGMLVISDTLFKEIYPDYPNLISSVNVKGTHDLGLEEVERLRTLVQREHSTQLRTQSMFQSRREGVQRKVIMGTIGFFFAFVLALIGVSNVVNTMTAGILTRKLEYASMQAVGMTKRQLFLHIMLGSMKVIGVSLALMLTAGTAVTWVAGNSPMFTGINTGLYAVSSAVLVALVLSLSAVLSFTLVHVLNRKSVVERLREIG